MTRDELSHTIGEVLKDWWFQDVSMGATQERLTAKLEHLLADSPTLPKLLDALGWQGGTVAQALEEVRRLKAARTPDAMALWVVFCAEIDRLKLEPTDDDLVALRDCEDVGAYMAGRGVKAIHAYLGQGVAALLPEHGEVKIEVTRADLHSLVAQAVGALIAYQQDGRGLTFVSGDAVETWLANRG